ncbi:MAG: DUF5668 domain-containing protein [Patescibacteria group bacterium]
MDKKNVCSCVHHKMIPILVMLFGALFLLLNFNILTEDFVNLAWPLTVIAAGAVKLGGRKCRCC